MLDLIDQLLRHWLARLIMLRVIRQDRWVQRPMLIELRREFDKVARHAAQCRILDVREHRVQRVSKLMEHRGHVIKADQRRLARTWLREVTYVYDDGLRA